MKRKRDARPSRDLVIIGTPPARATHFVLQRFDRGTWLPVGHLAEDGVEVHERPIAALSLGLIRKQGAGKYRVRWFEVAAGQRVPMGIGRAVTIGDKGTEVASAAPPGRAALPNAPDAVNSVAVLWNIAQRQADTWAQQYGAQAERAIERERAHFQLQLEQQRAFFNEMDRLRRESTAAPPSPEMARIVESIGMMAKRLDARMDRVPDDEEPDDPPSTLETVQGVVETIGETWMPHIGPHLGVGMGTLFAALAGYVQRATDRLPSATATVPALDSSSLVNHTGTPRAEVRQSKRSDETSTLPARDKHGK